MNDELYNSILEKPGDGGGGGGEEEVIDKVTNASLTLTVQEDSVVVDKIVDVIDDAEPEKDSPKGANGVVENCLKDVVTEEDRNNVTTSPNKRKAEEEPVEELNMSEVKVKTVGLFHRLPP